MGFTARDYYNSTPDDCCETDVGPDVAGVGGFDLGCKPGMATLGAGAGLLFFGSFPAVLAGGALGWLLGKEKGERVGSVGFIAIGKKAKAHQEKKRAFEIKEMQRAEAKAAAEAEIEKLELEIKRATLVKQAQEAGVAVPASLVRAVQQKVAVAEKKVEVAEQKAEKAEAAAIIAGLAVGAVPRVHFESWPLNNAASELLISARTLGRLTRAGMTPGELETSPDSLRYEGRLQAFNRALAEYGSSDDDADLDEFYATHDRIANESGLPRLGDDADGASFRPRKRFEVPLATTWMAKQKAAKVAADRPVAYERAATTPEEQMAILDRSFKVKEQMSALDRYFPGAQGFQVIGRIY